jgi:3'-phosphoadenosine 5'-phosphosulfate sulfotransferase (PAPS reductase)/FAD synthetase
VKHICLFSGGAASALMSQMVADEHGAENVILLHTPTFSEHPDADRFRKQVADRIGIPITTQADGRDIWQIIDDENCLPSNWIPFCTRILKQEQAEKFYKTLTDDFVIYAGYGADEPGRIQKQTARFSGMWRKARYPLAERGLTGADAKRIIIQDWGICLPEPYKYLEHNNCIPCFKGGVRHFWRVWKHYPEQFWKAVEKERAIGHTVFKDKSLEEYAQEWAVDSQQISMLDDDDGRPCLCTI